MREIEYGSGNVFADLGLEDANELYARGLLGLQLLELVEGRGKLTQREVVGLLEISQPEVSKLLNEDFSRFSEGRLLAFLRRLDQKVTFQISPRQAGEAYQSVIYAA